MLTDEGFPANYAFPEAGVHLKSVLLGDGCPDRWVWLRPMPQREELPTHELRTGLPLSPSAELCPMVSFMAQGRGVRSHQGSTPPQTGRALAFSAPLLLRLAADDDGLRPQGVATLRPQWLLRQGQVQEMARLRQGAGPPQEDFCPQRLGDDSDERNPQGFLHPPSC